MQQETPENYRESTPRVRSAAVTMEDSRAGDCVESGATAQPQPEFDQFREQGRANGAALAAAAIAVGARASTSEVHEEAKLEGLVEVGVRRHPEAHCCIL